MKRVINFVKGKRVVNSNISVEITNPLGQKVPSEDEHIIGLQSGYGYEVDLSGRDKSMTKLHKAAWQGNLEKVKLHLKKVDINAIDEFNRTPLHLAAAKGHTNIVCFLLKNKALPDIIDTDGMTPLLKAVECGVKECVGVLVEQGVNINATDVNGNTALHITAKQGFFNIMSILLKSGANCDCTNNAGEMALHIATEQEHLELVELLLQAGAHVNVVDRDNRTPLMLAAKVGQASLVSLLLKYGAQLQACDNNGWTAEDYAAIARHEQLALELKVPQISQSLTVCDIAEVVVESSGPEELKIDTSLSQSPNKLKENELPDDNDGDENCITSVKSPPQSVLVVEEEAQDSPRSCVTPPPLNPPRSWEIIQAGMIDNTQVRRRSLMALGTLESHRESFVDNNNGLDNTDIALQPTTTTTTTTTNFVVRTDSVTDAEWDSDDSLPLDRSLPPPPDLPDSSLESNLLLPEFAFTPDSSLPQLPELLITPDRRSRITLERTPSLDLTDSEIMDCNKVSSDETCGRDGTVKGTDEIWESNNLVLSSNNNNNNEQIIDECNIQIHDTGQCNSINGVAENEAVITDIDNFEQILSKGSVSLDNLDECERLCSHSGTGTAGFTQSLDSLDEESPAGTVIKRNKFHESHSLELLELSNNCQRQHSRNKSMSMSASHWVAPLDKQRSIDAQLQCYDEALRELAKEQRDKQDLLQAALDQAAKPLPQSSSATIQRVPYIALQQVYGGSLAGTVSSNTPDDDYKRLKKSNTIDIMNTTSFSDEKTLINKYDILPQTNKNGCKPPAQSIKKEEISKQSVPSSSKTFSIKPKSGKRSSSVNSRGNKTSFENKQKFYSSLELPPRYKKDKHISSDSVADHFIDWKTLPATSVPSVQQETQVHHLNKVTQFKKKDDKELVSSPRYKKSLKKEKSEGDLRRKIEVRDKKKVGRSKSLYVDRYMKYDEVLSNKEKFLSEKSESDSEWSEIPLQNKRKQLSAMRGMVADSEDSNDEDPPFWLNTGQDSCFSRQDTVIYNEHISESSGKKDFDREQYGLEGTEEGSSSSDTGSASYSCSVATGTPHSYMLKGEGGSLLREHLKRTTEEKAQLEELAARQQEQTERLQYELADAAVSVAARDDQLIILRGELARLSQTHASTLDELNTLKQRLTAAEIQLCELTRINFEKEHKIPDFSGQQVLRQLQEANKGRKRLELEKETLEAQHIKDIKKLQQDTIHWKNLYEDAVSNLEQIEGLCDPCLIENNQHLDQVKSAFKKFRDEKSSGRHKFKVSDKVELSGTENQSKNDELIDEDIEANKNILSNGETNNNLLATLQLQLQQEKSRCSVLENQVQKMLSDLQTKIDLEAELENLNHRLEREFVPRVELDQLRANQEAAIGRIRQQALIESETKLNVKLTEINQILQLQLQEQNQKERQRELVETQMKQEFENTRQKLLLELSRVQAALKDKEAEEGMLREKCDAMTQEAEKSQELKRRQLIEKSYSVNLANQTSVWEKELTVKQSVVPPPPPPLPLALTPPGTSSVLFSANSLRQQLELSISKNRDIQLSLVGDDRLPSPPGRSQQ